MKNLSVLILLIASVPLFLSNRVGRGRASGPATTAPGESGQFCGSFGCHFSGNFDPEAEILLFNDMGEPVESYIPGAEYDVNLVINHSGTPDRFGFQMVALRDSDNEPVNNFHDLPQNIHEIELLGRQYVEHSAPLPTHVISVPWTAPAEGTGDVKFYAAGNAVNFNGGSSGDGADTTRTTVMENMTSSREEHILSRIEVWPNPAMDIISIRNRTATTKVLLYNETGDLVRSLVEDREDISALPPGLYYAVVRQPGLAQNVHKIIKL